MPLTQIGEMRIRMGRKGTGKVVWAQEYLYDSAEATEETWRVALIEANNLGLDIFGDIHPDDFEDW